SERRTTQQDMRHPARHLFAVSRRPLDHVVLAHLPAPALLMERSCTVKPPVNPPVQPMLAKLSREMPTRDGVMYEPKWDGFRCIVFRDGDEVELGSRNEKPLTRYFPDVVEAVKRELPARCVVDGE